MGACCLSEVMLNIGNKVDEREVTKVNNFGFVKEVEVTSELWEKYRTHAAGLYSEYRQILGFTPLAVMPIGLWEEIITNSGLYRFETIDRAGRVKFDAENVARVLSSKVRAIGSQSLTAALEPPEKIVRQAIRCINNFTPLMWPDKYDAKIKGRNTVGISFHDFEGYGDMEKVAVSLSQANKSPKVAVEEALINVNKKEANAALEKIGDNIIRQMEEEEAARARQARDPIIYTFEGNSVVVAAQVGHFPQEKQVLDRISKITKKEIMDFCKED